MTDDVAALKPAEALRQLDEAERAAREANAAADKAKAAKQRAKLIALQVLEREELDSAKVALNNGRRVTYSTYQFRAYRVTDRDSFAQWAADQDESYFDPEPKLREQTLLDECRRRFDDGAPLPPGVEEYTETRLSRTAEK